jgi:hypothetical protein
LIKQENQGEEKKIVSSQEFFRRKLIKFEKNPEQAIVHEIQIGSAKDSVKKPKITTLASVVRTSPLPPIIDEEHLDFQSSNHPMSLTASVYNLTVTIIFKSSKEPQIESFTLPLNFSSE